jgi:hypothetical protein
MAYSVIKKPSDYFNTKLYTGTGSAGQAQTGVGFQPDLVWTKSRSNTYPHQWYDVIRGVTKRIQSNDTSAEATQSNGLSSFDSDGFTVGDASGTGVNSATYAAWNWLANGAGVANTDGTISSTVSANTTSGFSIVSYTGTGSNATVGHGLSVAPKMVIVKNRNGTQGWGVYHASLGNTKYLQLNDTAAEGTASTFWNNTTPTNQVFSIGTSGWMNNSGENYIAYCFAEKQGYSKFGSYTGNGNADGTFVYTGFKPAFVMIKRTDSATGGYWVMFDNKRNTFNVMDKYLFAQASDAEATSNLIDFYSNGFRPIVSNLMHNGSGASYIYMAFAEEPLVGDNPATAR